MPCRRCVATSDSLRFRASTHRQSREQFERRDLTSRIDMSTAAKVVEFAVGMAREGHALILRNAVDDLLLVSVVGYEHAGIIT